MQAADVDATATAAALAMSRGFAALLLTDGDTIDAHEARRTCDLWITSTLSPRRAGG
jgi:hypothetical protein